MKKAFFYFLTLSLLFGGGDGCQTRLFTLQSEAGMKIREFIDNLAHECHYTVIVKDSFAKEKLSMRLEPISLQDASLEEILHILLEEHDLAYALHNGILKIRYLITKTFSLDYVSSSREATTTLDASAGGGGGGMMMNSTTSTRSSRGVGGGQSSNNDINRIESKEKFTFWENIQNEIYNVLVRPEDEYKPKLSDPIAPVIIDENAGLVTVTGTKRQVERVQNYIDMLHSRLKKQVLIDVSILAVTLDSQLTTGIDWSQFHLAINQTYDGIHYNTSPTPSLQYEYIKKSDIPKFESNLLVLNTNFYMSGLLNFLKQSGDVYSLSNPKILTLNNQPAMISIGKTLNYNILQKTIPNQTNANTEISYMPYSLFVGILLNITPQISDNDEIILRINPTISELLNPEDELITGVREIAPDTKEKKLSSVVKLKSGSTLVLGGLISNTKNFQINGVPILKDIPLLGNLFGSKYRGNQRFELVFVIRPKVIENKKEKLGLQELGFETIER